MARGQLLSREGVEVEQAEEEEEEEVEVERGIIKGQGEHARLAPVYVSSAACLNSAPPLSSPCKTGL